MTEQRTCSKCGVQPAGPGGILCASCAAAIEHQLETLYGTTEGYRASETPRWEEPQ